MITGKETQAGKSAELYQNVNGTVQKVLSFDTLTGQPLDKDSVPLAKNQSIIDAGASESRYYFKNTSTSVSATDNVSLPLSTQLLPGSAESTHIVVCRPLGDDGALYRVFLANNQIIMSVRPSTNKFRFYQQDSGGTTFTDSTSALVLGKTVAIAAVRSQAASGTVAIYLNGILDSSQTGQTFRSPTGTPTIASVGDAASYSFRGDMYRQIHFNYAITDENKIRRYSSGAKLDYEDVGGSMDISSSATWTNIGLQGYAESGNDITSYTSNGQFTSYAYLNIPKVYAGKRIRVYFNHTGTNDRMYLALVDDTITDVTPFVAANGNSYADFTPTKDSTKLMFQQRSASTSTGAFTISSIVQFGAVLDLEPENITDTMWVDASPNGLHGAVSGAIANRFTPAYSTRNYIINGGFDFWQRGGASGTSVVGAGGSGTYDSADRWKTNNAVSTKQQGGPFLSTPDIPGLHYFARWTYTSTSGGDYISYYNTLETKDVAQLRGKTVTISFYARVSSSPAWASGETLRLFVSKSATVDTSVTGFSDIKIMQWTPTTTFQRYSFSFTVPADGTCNSLRFIISGSAVTHTNGSWLDVTGVMLNEGSVAAPFERAGGTIGGELALCQRYYEKSYRLSDPVLSVINQGAEYVTAATNIGANGDICSINYRVSKRIVNHTAYVYSFSAVNKIYNYGAAADQDAAAHYQSEKGFAVQATGASRPTTGQQIAFHWAADAEL